MNIQLFNVLYHRLHGLFFCDLRIEHIDRLDSSGEQGSLCFECTAQTELGNSFVLQIQVDQAELSGLLEVKPKYNCTVLAQGHTFIPERSQEDRIEFLTWWVEEFPEASTTLAHLLSLQEQGGESD